MSGKMFAVLTKPKNPWEQLYDFRTCTYFYRNKITGEFSRVNPFLMELEAKSTRIPPKNNDPLWETKFDLETGEEYWIDIETGKVCFIRPEMGTFVSELPLHEFRKMPKRAMSVRLPSRKSIRSLAIGTKSTQSLDEEVEEPDKQDIYFEDFSRGTSAKQFDAAAMFGVGSDGH